MEEDHNPGDFSLPWVKLNTYAAYPYENKGMRVFSDINKVVNVWICCSQTKHKIQVTLTRLHLLIPPINGCSSDLISLISTRD